MKLGDGNFKYKIKFKYKDTFRFAIKYVYADCYNDAMTLFNEKYKDLDIEIISVSSK